MGFSYSSGTLGLIAIRNIGNSLPVAHSSSYNTAFATARSPSRIEILDGCILTNIFETHLGADDIIDLKLISFTQVAYCSATYCGYCEELHNIPQCKRLSLNVNNVLSRHILTASITYSNPMLVINIVDDLNRSVVFLFNVSNTRYEGDISAMTTNTIDQPVVYSFSRSNSAYFVGFLYSRITISRICTLYTKQVIRSGSDLLLMCEGTDSFEQDLIVAVDTALYNTHNKKFQLYVAVRMKNGIRKICMFNMTDLENRFPNRDNYSCGNKTSGAGIHSARSYSVSPKIISFDPAYPSDIKLAHKWNDADQFDIHSNCSFPCLQATHCEEIEKQREIVKPSEYYFIFMNETSADSVKVACHSVFPTCESLLDGALEDEMQCIWCSDSHISKSVNKDCNCTKRINPLEGMQCPMPDVKKEISMWWEKDKANIHKYVSSTSIKPFTTTKLIPQETQHVSSTSSMPNITEKFALPMTFILLIFFLFVFIQLSKWRRSRQALRIRSSRTNVANEPAEPLIIDNSTAVHINFKRKNDYTQLFDELDPNLKIDCQHLRFETTNIGEGYFGVVQLATYKVSNDDARPVACKILREGTTMAKFKHPRVVELIGISFTVEKDPIIVTDYLPNGDLLTFLRREGHSLTQDQLMQFPLQIAEGMQYLHSKKFIHRDLAARNCLLDSSMGIKIADFGLARECNDDGEYMENNDRALPIKWMAIEAIQNSIFTLNGDVWSYGVVLWEIMSRGMVPYESFTSYQILSFLKDGERLERPEACPEQMYKELMLKCWAAKMSDRPPFAAIVYLVKSLNL